MFYFFIFSDKLDLFEATCFITVAQELTLTAELMNVYWGLTNIRLGLKMEINQCPKKLYSICPLVCINKTAHKKFLTKIIMAKIN
jgi:hypothetical protein